MSPKIGRLTIYEGELTGMCYGNLKFPYIYKGKVEIGIYFCVTADILKKILQKCFWSSPLPTI